MKSKEIFSGKKVGSAISDNRLFIENCKENCPTALKIIGENIEVLNALYLIAEKSDILYYNKREIILGASNPEIQGKINSNMKISRGLAILARIGFIRRLEPFEIHDERFEKLLSYSKTKNQMRLINQTAIIIFDEYDYETVKNNALKWIELGYKTSNFKYRTVLDVEGPFEAHRLFPQV